MLTPPNYTPRAAPPPSSSPPAARFADQAAEPFDAEVTLCEQLASYLRKFTVAEAAAALEEGRDLSGALEGFKPIPVSRARAWGGDTDVLASTASCLWPCNCPLFLAPALSLLPARPGEC